MFHSRLLLIIHLIQLTFTTLASNLHLLDLLYDGHDVFLSDPLRPCTVAPLTLDYWWLWHLLYFSVSVKHLKFILLRHHLLLRSESSPERLSLLLLIRIEISYELVFQLLHLVLVDLSDLSLEKTHDWTVLAQFKVAGTRIQNLLQVLGLFCFIQDAVRPTWNT